MRCTACNVDLSDYESTLRCANTGDFLDLCMACINASGFDCYNDRDDLRSLADIPEINSLFETFEEYDDE